MSFPVVFGTTIGLAAGVAFCNGLQGIFDVFTAATTLLQSFPKISPGRIDRHAFGLFASLLLSCLVGYTHPSMNGQAQEFSLAAKTTVLLVLAVGFVLEFWSVVSTVHMASVRRMRLGQRDEQLLGMHHVSNTESMTVHGVMCFVYMELFFFYTIILMTTFPAYHQDAVTQRPVATMRYVEWSCTVPLLMWLVGRCLLENEFASVIVPILQTVSYIWLCWAGQVVKWHWLRALLISTGFTIYAISTVGQVRWFRRSKPSETFLAVYQCVAFLLYGIVYLLALANLIDPWLEDAMYTAMDTTVKVSHTAVFSMLRRNKEIDHFFASLRGYLDILVGLRALVGSQFDLLIHCEVTTIGLSISSCSMMVEERVGKPLRNRSLEDICFHESDRARVRQHCLSQQCRPRRSKNGATAFERQELLSHMANMLRIEIAWVEAPSGCAPAEMFVAASSGENGLGDTVLIGLKLLPEEFQEQQLGPFDDGHSDTASELSEFMLPARAQQNSSLQRHIPQAASAPIPQPQINVPPAATFPQPQTAVLPPSSGTSPQPQSDALPTATPPQTDALERQQSGGAEEQAWNVGVVAPPRQLTPFPMDAVRSQPELTPSLTELKLQQARQYAGQPASSLDKLQSLSQMGASPIKRSSGRTASNSSRISSKSFDMRSVSSMRLSPVEEVSSDTDTGSRGSKAQSEAARSNISKARSEPGSSKDLSPQRESASDPIAMAVQAHLDARSDSNAMAVDKPSVVFRPQEGSESGTSEHDQGTNRSITTNNDGDKSNNDGSSSLEGSEASALDPLSPLDQSMFMSKRRTSLNDGEVSEAATLKTYRTSPGETRMVSANVSFLTNSGQLSALNFTTSTSCSEFRKKVEAEHAFWDWEKLVINQEELKTMSPIGRGSFATVFKSMWKDTPYAMKCFNAQAWMLKRRGFPYAVRREISILAHLSSLAHPNLCRMAAIVVEPRIALLFEYCEGGTLANTLYNSIDPLSREMRFSTLEQILKALVHLHENQVIHRDIKDNNILFVSSVMDGSEPHVKLTDVGLARWLEDPAEDDDAEGSLGWDTKMTPLPSVDWCAPEVISGFYSTSVDIFAFAVVALEVAIWRVSLPRGWRETVKSLSSAPGALPFTAFLNTCLSEASERPSAAECLKSLTDLQDGDMASLTAAFDIMTEAMT